MYSALPLIRTHRRSENHSNNRNIQISIRILESDLYEKLDFGFQKSVRNTENRN